MQQLHLKMYTTIDILMLVAIMMTTNKRKS